MPCIAYWKLAYSAGRTATIDARKKIKIKKDKGCLHRFVNGLTTGIRSPR